MKFGRKLTTLIVVFLMVFGSFPVTNVVAAGGYDYTYQGPNNDGVMIYGYYQTALGIPLDNSWATSTGNMKKSGVNYKVYSDDIGYILNLISTGGTYKRDPLGGANAGYVRAVLAAGSYGYSGSTVIAAKQAAIWHFTNSFVLEDYWTLLGGWHRNSQNIKDLYAIYIGLSSAGSYNDTTLAIMTVQFNKLLTYNADCTKADIQFTVHCSADLDSPVFTPSSGSVDSMAKLNGGDNLITVKGASTSGTLTLNVSASQTIAHDACTYDPNSGITGRFDGVPYTDTATITSSGSESFGGFKIMKGFEGSANPLEGFTMSIGGTALVAARAVTVHNSDGWVPVNGLPFGSYTISEALTDAQKVNYQLVSIDNPNITISNTTGSNASVDVTNRKIAKLIVTLSVTDGAGGSQTFPITVTGPNGYNKSFLLADGGTWSADSLLLGSYTVTEGAMPTGYCFVNINGDTSSQSKIISVNDTGNFTAGIVDRKMFGSIVVTKAVKDGAEKPGDDFTFQLYQGSTLVATKHIQYPDKQCTFGRLEFGSYTVKELDNVFGYSAPDDYKAGFPVSISNETPAGITCTNQKLHGSIVVTKHIQNGDEKTGDDFTFQLYQGGSLVTTKHIQYPATQCTFDNLEYGDYTVKELDNAFGYSAPDTYKAGVPVTVNGAAPVGLDCTNQKLHGSIVVNKTIKDGDEKSGDVFTFQLYQGSKLLDTQQIKYPATQCSFDNLEYGDYTVHELDNAFGYGITDDFKAGVDVTVSKPSTVIGCENQKLHGSITVNKTIKDGDEKAGDDFTFELYQAGNLIDTQHIKYPAAQCSFNNLEYGDYTVKELDNAFGYSIPDDFKAGLTVSVNGAEEINCENQKLHGSIQVNKTIKDGDEKAGDDFTFELYQGGNLIDTQHIKYPATQCSFNNLEYGDYTVQELDNALGYSIPDDFKAGVAARVDSPSPTVVICENQKLYGSITVNKTIKDGDEKAGDDFTFELYQGGSLIDTQHIKYPATQCSFDNLEYGDYTVKELDDAFGYSIPDDFRAGVAVKVDGAKEISCENQKLHGSITVDKTIKDGDEKAGDDFTFELYQGGTLIDTQHIKYPATQCSFNNLEYGDYTVKELDDAFGYGIPDDFKAGVAVRVDGAKEIGCENQKLHGSITVSKTIKDGDEKAGDDFTFELYQGGSLIDTQHIKYPATQCSFNNLEYGNYTVKELDDAFGYGIPDDFKAGVAVRVDGAKEISCENQKLHGSITVNKTIKDGDEKAGDDFTFELYQGGNLIDTQHVKYPATQCSFNNLEYGDYTVKELDDAFGYGIPGDFKAGVAVKVDGAKEIGCENQKLHGSIQVNKTIKDGDEKAGDDFTFELYQDGNLIDTQHIKYPATQCSFNNLEYGDYTVKELDDAFGYSIPDDFKTGVAARVDSPSPTEISCENQKLHGSITVNKTIKDGDEKAGDDFTFELYQGGNLIDTQHIKYPATQCSFNNLEYGDYTVKELDDAFGYTIPDDFKAGVAVRVDGAKEIGCENQKLHGSITVNKTIKDGDENPGDDFTFELYQGSKLIDTQHIKYPAAQCSFNNLEYGSYTVKELDDAFGYGIPGDFKAGVAVKVDGAKEISCENQKLHSSIVVTKHIDNGNPKDGDTFTFDLYKKDGTFAGTQSIIATAETTCKFGNLEYGDYVLKERFASGYTRPVNFVTGVAVPIDSPDTVEVSCTNTKLYGSITVNKVFAGVTEGTLKDGLETTFDLYAGGAATGNPIATQTCKAGTSAQVVFSGLEYNQTYTVKEEDVPGYQADSAFALGQAATITDNEPGFVFTCTNTQLHGSVTFDKVVENVEGDKTEFTVDITGDNGYSGSVTIGNGKIGTLDDLPFGHYTMNEEDNGAYRLVGYSTETDKFSIGADDYATPFSITVTNHLLQGWIGFVKKDKGTNGYLSGAVFQISTADGEAFGSNIVATVISSSDGLAKNADPLPAGEYYVREYAPPSGYLVDDGTIIPVPVNDDETNILPDFFDTEDVGGILVKKTSSFDGSAVTGAEFQLLDKDPASDGFSDSDIIDTARTDGSGEIIFSDLPTGSTYWVRESAAATNYNIDSSDAQFVTIALQKNLETDFTDTPYTHLVINFIQKPNTLVKSAASEGIASIPGAVYGVYTDSECKTPPAYTLTVADSGASIDLPFPAGMIYYVKQISPATGYMPDGTVYPITYTGAGTTYTLTISAKLDVGSIVVKMEDVLNPSIVLAGATFELYFDLDCTHLAAAAQTTGSDGTLRFDGLEPGTYYLKQTKAPTDYTMLTDPVSVNVDPVVEDPTLVVLTNQYNPPKGYQTGMMDWNFLIIGAAMLAIGLLLVLFMRKRRMGKKSV